MATFFELNDNNVWVNGVFADIPQAFVNDAVFAFTLYDTNGLPITNATSLSMTYLTSSNGRYYVTCPGTISIREPEQGTYVIQSSNYTLRFEGIYTTRKRR